MSTPVSAAEVQQNFISICCGISATVLLVYEYLITFDREYQLVWKRRFSAATLLILLARYSLLLEFILQLPSISPLSTTSCSALVWLVTVFQLLFLLLVAAFAGLRTYALSGRQWQIASLVFILPLVSFSLALFGDVRQVAVVEPPPINCVGAILVPSALDKSLTYVRNVTIITAETLVLLVTIHQTYGQRRAAAEANLRTPLYTVILRDGTAYFLALLIMNITEIVLVYFEDTFTSGPFIDEFIDPITAIIISRFVLNLREIDASPCGTEETSPPSFVASLQFATFVEPLGAPLDHEISFSTIDPGSLDAQGADEEREDEDVLDNDEEVVSGRTSVRGTSEADPGPSGVRKQATRTVTFL